ncbi:MAG: cyclase family protein [Flavobacteriales bacterium]|nr:cyclase family protein [Flavobacteriales bacterium]
MSKYVYLSHLLNSETPLYGGVKNITIEADSKMKAGDTANTLFLKFNNHSGTHVDFPKHFSDSGKSLNDYGATFWQFDFVFLYEVEAQPGEIIDIDLNEIEIPIETEFLVIKSNFENYRSDDLYWKDNPGVSPQLASKVKQRCPNLRVLGFDFISLTPQQNKPIGREAHRKFLLDNNILIIEDMRLKEVNSNSRISSITCLPLAIDQGDGAPVTIIAKVE